MFFTYFVNKIEKQAIFFIVNTNPRFAPFLLYVRCKSGVTLIRRKFRDVSSLQSPGICPAVQGHFYGQSPLLKSRQVILKLARPMLA